MKTRTHRIVRTLPVAVFAFVALAVPAYGDTTPAATTDAVTATQQQMAEMQLRYGSLSAAMAQHYAGRQNQAIASYLLGSPGSFGTLAGVSSSEVKSLASALPEGATVEQLDAALSTAGLTLSSNAYSSVSAAAAEVRAKAATLDAAVAQAGIAWAGAMLRLHAPELITPPVPNIDTSSVTGMPAEGLAFGMFMNRSLNAMVRSFPDVFSQVSASGVGSSAAQTAWNKSMTTAMAASKPDLTKMLPTKCGAAFLGALAGSTGSSPAGCSPCVAAGRLAGSQLDLLFDPSKGSTIPDPSNPALNPSEWSSLTPYQREQLAQQNKSVNDALAGSTSGGSTGCTAAGSAVQRNVQDVLPDVLDYLGK